MSLSSKLDLLLVTPPSRAKVYQSLSNDLAATEPPVWAGLIAKFMLDRGFNVKMLDAEARALSFEQTADEIVREEALLTVFVIYGQQPSASTQCMPAGRAVCEMVNEKNGDLLTLVMGTHSSAIPEKTLQEEPYDFVCEGEGPYTILRLVEELKSSRLAPKLENVPGLVYEFEGGTKRNPTAGKIKDLDQELPRQAWELLDMSLYRAHNWQCFDDLSKRQSYASLQTSLGCPYKCTFCCINAPFGGAGIRFWSPENIISQIDVLVQQYGVKNIKIPDELFVLNRGHVIGICEKIIERGYDLNIWCYTRVDTIQDDFMETMRKAGIRWLGVGIESANKSVRKDVQKGRFEDIDIKAVVAKVRAHGFYVAANYIFGLPEDDYASMQQTLDMAMDLNTEWANFYSAMAYPGSQLYTMAVQGKWLLPDSWLGFSQHAYETLPLPTKHLSGPEVLAFRDVAFGRYFSNPAYISQIRSKFGEPVVEHLKFMLDHKLERKFKPESTMKARAEGPGLQL